MKNGMPQDLKNLIPKFDSQNFEVIESKPWHPVQDDCPYLNISPQTLHACSEMMRQAAMEPPEAVITDRGSYTEVVVGAETFRRPRGETPVDFLIAHLKYTFGTEWAEEQYARAEENRHVVMRWWSSFCDLQKASAGPDYQTGDVYEVQPSGDALEFMSLADALYRLRVVDRLRPKMINRLRHHEEFQGARYECGIAAAFVRVGFDIAWQAGSSKKCEFIATHMATGESFAVEVKSRRRPGTVNQSGSLPNLAELSLDVNRLYDSARSQCPADIPCLICLDVNLPREVIGESGALRWWENIKQFFGNYPEPTAEAPALEMCVVLTNYSWHYSGQGRAQAHPYDFIFSGFVKHRLTRVGTFVDLIRAIRTYGHTPTGSEVM